MPLTTFMWKYSQGKTKNGYLPQMKNDGTGNDYIILDDFHFGGFKMKMGNVQVTGCIGGILYENYFIRFVSDLVAGDVPVIGLRGDGPMLERVGQEEGHDENINFDEAVNIVGKNIAEQARELSIELYKRGRDHAAEKGIIIADTKFEFGIFEGELILIDEVLTPDSSRFWPADLYAPGKSQPSFDKHFVRDYLETLDWDKPPPGPELPAEIVQKTSEKYIEAYTRVTGLEF